MTPTPPPRNAKDLSDVLATKHACRAPPVDLSCLTLNGHLEHDVAVSALARLDADLVDTDQYFLSGIKKKAKEKFTSWFKTNEEWTAKEPSELLKTLQTVTIQLTELKKTPPNTLSDWHKQVEALKELERKVLETKASYTSTLRPKDGECTDSGQDFRTAWTDVQVAVHNQLKEAEESKSEADLAAVTAKKQEESCAKAQRYVVGDKNGFLGGIKLFSESGCKTIQKTIKKKEDDLEKNIQKLKEELQLAETAQQAGEVELTAAQGNFDTSRNQKPRGSDTLTTTMTCEHVKKTAKELTEAIQRANTQRHEVSRITTALGLLELDKKAFLKRKANVEPLISETEKTQ